MSPSRRFSAAFTLVELLVVTAIIALLMAILLPSLSRAREQSKSAVCLSNMRNLGVAVRIYVSTDGGRFPSAGSTHGSGNSWVTQLLKAIGRQTGIERCLSDRSVHWTQPLADGSLRLSSYASSSYTTISIGGRPAYDRDERVPRPSVTVFWAELAENGASAASDHIHPESWWTGDSRETASNDVQLARHGGRANYCMVDGHAEALLFERTYVLDPAGGFPPRYLTNKYDPEIAR